MTHLPELRSQLKPLPCVMQVVRVSGTIRKAEEEVIKRAKAGIIKARVESQNGSSGGLETILGSSAGEVPSQVGWSDPQPVSGIEDVEDDDEDEDGESMT